MTRMGAESRSRSPPSYCRRPRSRLADGCRVDLCGSGRAPAGTCLGKEDASDDSRGDGDLRDLLCLGHGSDDGRGSRRCRRRRNVRARTGRCVLGSIGASRSRRNNTGRALRGGRGQCAGGGWQARKRRQLRVTTATLFGHIPLLGERLGNGRELGLDRSRCLGHGGRDELEPRDSHAARLDRGRGGLRSCGDGIRLADDVNNGSRNIDGCRGGSWDQVGDCRSALDRSLRDDNGRNTRVDFVIDGERGARHGLCLSHGDGDRCLARRHGGSARIG
ncbi:uncharacterized protein PG998_014834 [Apiospora kogelbergensis]|uniref:uncharacterized protein n=1 Tax=Apiospora kogelbergensis TaxID=1337665 RepID=UPI00312F737E